MRLSRLGAQSRMLFLSQLSQPTNLISDRAQHEQHMFASDLAPVHMLGRRLYNMSFRPPSGRRTQFAVSFVSNHQPQTVHIICPHSFVVAPNVSQPHLVSCPALLKPNRSACTSAPAGSIPNKAIQHMRAGSHQHSGSVRRSRGLPALAAGHFPKATTSFHLSRLKSSSASPQLGAGKIGTAQRPGVFGCEHYRADHKYPLHFGHIGFDHQQV
jgi:hypothetical protein